MIDDTYENPILLEAYFNSIELKFSTLLVCLLENNEKLDIL